MEGRLAYQFAEGGEAGASASFQRYTVDRGLNSALAVNFIVDARDDACIDLSQCYLKSSFRVVDADGSALENATKVFLGPNYGPGLWSQVSVSLNNTVLGAGNDYAYVAMLMELLGSSPTERDSVMRPLAGWVSPVFTTSDVETALAMNPVVFEDLNTYARNSKQVDVYHRIHSDFMLSCSQLLPNKMQLGVTLTRGKDSFVIGRHTDDSTDYKIEMISVSLFVKRILPSPGGLARLNENLAGGGKLLYQRLHMIALPCAQGSQTWNWHNCFNNVLPRRVFLAVVDQASYFGSYSRVCTYLESAHVAKVRFCQDGREIMPEPYSNNWVYQSGSAVDWEASDAKTAFAGLCQTLGVLNSPRQFLGTNYMDFRNGSTIYAVSLDHALRHGAEPGSLDVHLDFSQPTDRPLMILVMGEYPKTLSFDSSRNISQL